jgi:putative two-component system hydrogenase maturation factor HypX/HoxX
VRILFLTSAHNSLSQKLFVELTDRGHEIRVKVVAKNEEMIEAAAHEVPDLIIAPRSRFLKKFTRAIAV